MTTDKECLDNIRKNLQNAIVNLYEVSSWIDKREDDYYQRCDGFSRVIHQLENLYRSYNYEYLKKMEGEI